MVWLMASRKEGTGAKGGPPLSTNKDGVRRSVGKVKPMPPRNSKEEDDQEEKQEVDLLKSELLMNKENERRKALEAEDDDDNISLLGEEDDDSTTPAKPLLINEVDPTKDFYSTTTGRPVSPVQLLPPQNQGLDQGQQGSEAEKKKRNRGSETSPASTTTTTTTTNAGVSERVKVIVRSRPLSEKEKAQGHQA